MSQRHDLLPTLYFSVTVNAWIVIALLKLLLCSVASSSSVPGHRASCNSGVQYHWQQQYSPAPSSSSLESATSSGVVGRTTISSCLALPRPFAQKKATASAAVRHSNMPSSRRIRSIQRCQQQLKVCNNRNDPMHQPQQRRTRAQHALARSPPRRRSWDPQSGEPRRDRITRPVSRRRRRRRRRTRP